MGFGAVGVGVGGAIEEVITGEEPGRLCAFVEMVCVGCTSRAVGAWGEVGVWVAVG
jgi:hypothetical protein